MDYPHISHRGATRGVTGSCHHLHCDPQHDLLIDCGLFQGAETSPGGAGYGSLAIDFDIGRVQALVLTHVHIDHVGRLPWLLAAGYEGPIVCSEPSAKLLPVVLEDAFRLGVSRDQQTVEHYLSQVADRLQPLPYQRWYALIDQPRLQVSIRLQRAGHILGSAYVECDIHYPEEKRRHRVVFSGDLGAPYAPILKAPKAPYRADTLVIESTYGNRLHESRKTRQARLQKVIEKALANRGTVLIPAFSIGRTQELLCELEDIVYRHARLTHGGRRQASIHDEGSWPQLPIILDSPLASRFTRAYRDLQPFWQGEAIQRVQQGRRPLAFDTLLTVDDHATHQRILRHLCSTARPAIVIAGNGMCGGGRIVNYLKAMLGDPRHDVLFVGYQAQGTPGRAIQQYGPQGGYVDLDGERLPIRAGIDTIGGYSAHADQQGLVDFVTRMRRWPQQIRIVHGDREAKQALAQQLRQAYQQHPSAPMPDILIP